MDQAHSIVATAASTAIRNTAGGVDLGKVIDLGCGNGALLQEILDVSPWLVPCGVEENEMCFQRAARRLLAYDPELRHCSIYDDAYWDPPYTVALLSVEKITGVDEIEGRELLKRLRDGCHRLVLYAMQGNTKTIPYLKDYFKLVSSFSNVQAVAYLLEPIKGDN